MSQPIAYSRITLQEFEKNSQESTVKWISINGFVYDITHFSKIHPGGSKVICSYSGTDATDVWTALHPNKSLVEKYMKPLLVGKLESNKEEKINSDFRSLRLMAESKGWFRIKPLFFVLHLLQVHLFELLGILTLWYFGVNYATYIVAAILLATAQAQAGWAQHDYGHLSVFSSMKLNHIAHEYVVGHLKGASSRWWNFRHNLHHSKPNIVPYDPDIALPYFFLLGKVLPILWGSKKKGFMPYNWQHNYFFLIGPPLLLPLYFHFEVVYFILKRKIYKDFIWTLTFFFKFYFIFNHFFDNWLLTFGLYMFARFLESHWFTMVTQMSHIPMEVDRDKNDQWLKLQLKATCNATSNPFNDWFTGHLNYQIEHHLFPGMPRHNYPLVKPHVQKLCRKYGLDYQEKPLLTAFCDIYRSLKKSGELWFDAYMNPG